jgi:hypothetical protein
MRYGVISEATPSVKLPTTSELGAGAGTGLRGDFHPVIFGRKRRYNTIRWNMIYTVGTHADAAQQ